MAWEGREKHFFVLNVSLGVVAVILILMLFDVSLLSVGKAVGFVSKEEPICLTSFHGRFSRIDDLNLCCLRAREQLGCSYEKMYILGNDLTWRCQTGKGSAQYLLNTRAYSECRESVVWK